MDVCERCRCSQTGSGLLLPETQPYHDQGQPKEDHGRPVAPSPRLGHRPIFCHIRDPGCRRAILATSTALLGQPPLLVARHPHGDGDETPALIDDAMREVFTRLPADDPRSLVRAAAVCRSWRGILTDPGFARGYRAFHGAPPMLGFLHNAYRSGNCFVPTSTFRWRASQDRDCLVLDSRHGLVLLYAPAYEVPFDACDLVANKWWEICSCYPPAIGRERVEEIERHLQRLPKELAPGFEIDTGGRTAVVGNNKVYVQSYEGDSVVEYNIREQQLSVIMAPDIRGKGYLDLLGVEDGMLLFGSVLSHRLYLCLWSMEAGPRGAAAWARHRVVDLEPLPPHRALMDMSDSDLWAVGFAEGVGVIFLRTPAGLHTVELNSGRVNKVGESRIEKVMPYTSFCARAWRRVLASDEASRALVGGGVN
ncbi:hypothetical protein ZWY2020_005109 [Hordeum vulgare]|nr:hypothetical protein ZWY2020_005109 [Hordeum vulgare]